jgi:hypothetical protein
MPLAIDLNTLCSKSDGVVAREIEDEILIVPLVAGIGDPGDELYTLNPTGQAIWQQLDGERTLGEVAARLADEFGAPVGELEADVLGFATELTRRGLLTARS